MSRSEEVEFDAEDEGSEASGRRPVRSRIAVLHDDDDLLVVSKPPSVWLDESPDDVLSVIEQLEEAGLAGGDRPAQFIYPLDADVSGVLLAARSDEAAENLQRQASTGSLGISCLAMVRGPVMRNEGEMALHLSPLPRGGGRMKIDGKGSEAHLKWKVVDHFIGFALLKCRTQPPYPHQVRALLEGAGLPLAVDSLYGGATELRLSSFKAGYRPSRRHRERPLIERVSMHIDSAQCVHPRTGESMMFQAPAPKDFRAALHQLERFGRMPSS
ncbi:MAG TPA: pseudouridine synthase [Phycisphaerae bacterium]|nr:pseudouridine synthase [Phycisphaerae bacterium]